jgi:hypothetical protein
MTEWGSLRSGPDVRMGGSLRSFLNDSVGIRFALSWMTDLEIAAPVSYRPDYRDPARVPFANTSLCVELASIATNSVADFRYFRVKRL